MKFQNVPFTALACSILLWSCNQPEQKPNTLVPNVNVVPAGQLTVPVFTEYVGQTYGESDIEIVPRIDGWVTHVNFKEGDLVKKGQLLYEIDDLPVKTKIDAAIARVAQANTQLVKTRADLSRVEPLTAMNALSKRDLDAAVAMNNAAKAEVDIADAQLNNARIELSYTKILAPISGIIGLSKVQQGDYVSRMSSAALNTISSTGEIRVRFSISEQEFLKYTRTAANSKSPGALASNIPVQLMLSDGSTYAENGKIDLTNRSIDPQTGSMIVQAIFSNKQALLRPGQYVKVKVQTGNYDNALMLPQQAVNQMQNIYQVFVINDSNKVVPTVVKTGARVGSNWIISNGIKSTDKVAVIGSILIKPGMQVNPITMRWNYDSSSRR